MNCREAEKYIYLEKDWSGSQKESEFFEHISSCAKCSRCLEEMQNYNLAVSKIRETNPFAYYNPNLSEEIAQKIADEQKPKGKFRTIFFLDIFYFPSVKIAAAAVILLISLFYFGEEYRDFRKIHSLETKYAVNTANESANVGLASLPDIAKGASEFYSFLSGDKKLGELPGGWMLIKRTEMIKLLDEYKSYLNTNGALINQTEFLQKVREDNDSHKMIMDKEKISKFLDRYYRQEN
jgi:hypothetical protein